MMAVETKGPPIFTDGVYNQSVYEGADHAIPLHACRVDRKHTDPRQSICSSKLGRLTMIIAHHRRGLEQSHFGTIYGHFKMHEWHPSKPGRPAAALPFFPVPDRNPPPTWTLPSSSSGMCESYLHQSIL